MTANHQPVYANMGDSQACLRGRAMTANPQPISANMGNSQASVRGRAMTANPQPVSANMGDSQASVRGRAMTANPQTVSAMNTMTMFQGNQQTTNSNMPLVPPYWNMFNMPPPQLQQNAWSIPTNPSNQTQPNEQVTQRGNEHNNYRNRRHETTDEEDDYDHEEEEDYRNRRDNNRGNRSTRAHNFNGTRGGRTRTRRGEAEDQSFKKMFPRPKRYDGTTNFTSYEVQFTIYANNTSWTPEERLQMFAILVAKTRLLW
jgi:hypothetical protein